MCLQDCVSHYALYIVGSTMTGFGLDSSDIDMCLLLKPCTEDHRLDAVHQLHHIKNYLLKYGKIEMSFGWKSKFVTCQNLETVLVRHF